MTNKPILNGSIVTAEQIDVVAQAGAQVNGTIGSGSLTSGAGAGVSIDVGSGLDLHLP